MQDIDEMELIRIDESTVQDLLKQDEYNGITIDQLMQIWSFTNDWRQRKDKLTTCKMTLPFATSQDMLDFIQKFKDASATFKDEADKMTIANLGSNGPSMHFQAEINKAWQAPLMMATHKIWPYKVGGITFVKTPNGKWAIDVNSPDETVVATMWSLVQAARATSKDTEFKNEFAGRVKDAMEQDAKHGNRKFNGSIGKAKVATFMSQMDEQYKKLNSHQEYSTPVHSIDDVVDVDELKSVLQTTASTNSQNRPIVNKLQITGPFGLVKLAFFTILGKQMTDSLTSEEEQKFNQLCIPISYDSSTPEMKHLAKIVKADVDAGNFQNVDDAIQYMTDKKFGIALSNMKSIGDLTQKTNAENARKRQDGDADVPEDKEVESILGAQGIKEILDEYGQKDDDEDEQLIAQRIASHEWKAPAEDEPAPEGRAQPANDVAKRRMKLFEDIQHMSDPPKVYQYGHWICAVCYTRAQDYFWTRTKPKVYASGPNRGKIIEYANKRTDELDALVQNGTLTKANAEMYKAVRDCRTSSTASGAPKLYEIVDGVKTRLDYTNVKDGMKIPVRGQESSMTSDDLYGESYWCTAGALDIRNRCHGWDFEGDVPNINFWTSYNNTPDGRNPYWVIMDLNTGILYQHSRYGDSQRMEDGCLCESDVATDINGRYLSNVGQAQMAQAFLAERDYASMMNDIRRDSYSTRMAELKKSIRVTNDGYVVATTRDQLNAIMSLFSQVDGYHKLKLVGSDWSGAFYAKNVQFLTHIDLEGVSNAEKMFKKATISDTLQLENTESIVQASEMFCNAKNANIIRGINLDSAQLCRHMFESITTYHNLDLYLEGNFNMQNCSEISYMFYNSPVVNITLHNTDKVDDITYFFGGCTRLKQFPNAYFPKAKNNFSSIFGYSIDSAREKPLMLTQGISSPFKHDRKKAQEWIKNMFEYYSGEPLDESSVKTVKKNGKTLAVISSTQSIARVLNAIADDYAHATGKFDGITFENITNGRLMFDKYSLNWDAIKGSDEGKPRILCSTFDFGSLKKGEGLFNNVDINAITEFTGTESIEDASKLFMNAKVSQLPPMNFPNATHANAILAFVKTLDKLPILKFSYKCETDFASTTQLPGSQLFGEYDETTKSEIERRLSFNRVTSLMRRMQEHIDNVKNEHLMSLIQPDENGTIVVDKEQARELAKLKAFENKDFAEAVKTIKLNFNDATQLFENAKFNWMPMFDMEKVKTCISMFYKATIGENVEVKMANTSSILDCSYMFGGANIFGDPSWINNMVFQNCQIYSNMFEKAHLYETLNLDIRLPNAAKLAKCMFKSVKLDVSDTYIAINKLEFDNPDCLAEEMFYETKITSVNDKTLTTNIVNGTQMFKSAFIEDVKTISLPNTVNADSMFFFADFGKVDMIATIDIPNVRNAKSMFESVPSGSKSIIIGSINAPRIENANRMFRYSNIDSICFMNIPIVYEDEGQTSYMFNDSKLTSVYGGSAQILKSVGQAFAQLADAARAAQQETTTAA